MVAVVVAVAVAVGGGGGGGYRGSGARRLPLNKCDRAEAPLYSIDSKWTLSAIRVSL